MNEVCTCLNCGTTEAKIPLLALRYQGEQAWVCSRCMPVLIHHPEELTGKLPKAVQIPSGGEPHSD